jgi:hypothetical protein
MKIIKGLFILILLATSSCNPKIAKIFPKRPNQQFDFGDASPDYAKGFNDGCESGMAAGSNTFYKMFYRSNAADGYKMASSSDYKSGWGIGWWYCYRYDFIKHKSGLYGSFFRGHY